jgi:hypothetical protein
VTTKTHPGPWFLEDEQTIMTVIDILDKRAEAMEKATKSAKRR